MSAAVVHVPVLRAGVEYDSLERLELVSARDGSPLASISQSNAGMIRRDLRKIGAAAEKLRAIPIARLLEICAEAAERFLEDDLPIETGGASQTPAQYAETLSATSGLTLGMCCANMGKIATVLREMPRILSGLTRGLPLEILDSGEGEVEGGPVCFAPTTDALGVVLPSNSPGVNSIWIPSIALKTPVVLKPGREEPWTPLRIARALIAAGCPPEAFSLYPTDHEGAGVILDTCGRAQLFGDERVTAAYAHNPNIEMHGPGRSKIVLGPDVMDSWREHLEVLVTSVVANGGRSCVNVSCILTPAHGDEIAQALADEIAAIEPLAADDPNARLSSFANPKIAEAIDAAIERGLAAGGARDLCADKRGGPRLVKHQGSTYLRPTVVRCDSLEHPLANTEYLFPYVSVVEVPPEKLLEGIGHSLVVSGITRDPALQERLVASREIDRLNLGPAPTTRVDWDQPHEGNLFETLYARRAFHRAGAW